MLRRIACLLLVLAVALPASAAPATTSASKCLADVDVLLCVTATLTLDIACQRVDAGHVSCDAPFTWRTEGHSTALLPGAVQHAASALFQWCRPGAFCQGYGIGERIDACSWTIPLPAGCASGDTFNLNPGPIPYDGTGGCMTLDLSGFAEADGFLVGYMGHSLITAVTSNDVTAEFCG